MKRIISMALLLALLLTLAACGKEEAISGSGTAEDPYRIGTAAQLEQLAEKIREDDAYAAACYVLTGDIDLEGKRWTPVGSDERPFSGTFDGSGYTIRDFRIRDDGMDVGFFGKVTGTVRGLTIAEAQIQATDLSATAGSIVATLWGGTLEDCHTCADVTVTGQYQVGGLCGNASDKATLKGLTNAAQVVGEGNISTAGGIAGWAACFVEGCENDGAVTSGGDAAGIAVTMNAGAADCVNRGQVDCSGYAGGIVVHFSDGALNHSENDAAVELLRCGNSGTVTAGRDAAGIAVSCHTGKVTDCSNSGDISATGHCGGILAYFQISSFGGACELFTVSGCSNSGTVTGLGENGLYNSGGICALVFGEQTQIVFENCTNSGTVDSQSAAGGILGWGEVKDLQLLGCGNTGSVRGYRCVGGIMGRAIPLEDGTSLFLAENCVNGGEVFCDTPNAYFDENYCGGILGHQDKETLTGTGFAQADFVGCENTGKLSGTSSDLVVLCVHDLCGTMESNTQ